MLNILSSNPSLLIFATLLATSSTALFNSSHVYYSKTTLGNDNVTWPAFILQKYKAKPAEEQSQLEAIMAIAYIVVGDTAITEPFLVLSLSNLRLLGGWQGDVFVVTDRGECVPPSAKAVTVPPLPESPDNDKLAAVKYGKQFKQQLLNILPLSESHNYVLYMDMDIFIGKSIDLIFIKAIADFERKNAAIAVFREGTGINGAENLYSTKKISKNQNRYHSGMFLIARSPASKHCMEEWSKWYTSYWLDQPQLLKSIKLGACPPSLFPQESFSFPTANSSGTYFTFNHFTRTGRMLGKHGMDTAHFERAGTVLLGLSDALAKNWWKVKSPLCPA